MNVKTPALFAVLTLAAIVPAGLLAPSADAAPRVNVRLASPLTQQSAPVASVRVLATPIPATTKSLPKGMREVVWQRATRARDCAIRHGQISPQAKMAVIDYDMPSSAARLWVIDPSSSRVLLTDLVAHGSGSGQLMANSFSNVEGSYQTSLGVFRVGESYEGKHGASLRMDGLERGFNDQARARAIVMHSAWYVDSAVVQKTGRLGRSQGCPAVREQVLDQVEKALKGGGMVFAHASQNKWLTSSSFLHCS